MQQHSPSRAVSWESVGTWPHATMAPTLPKTLLRHSSWAWPWLLTCDSTGHGHKPEITQQPWWSRLPGSEQPQSGSSAGALGRESGTSLTPACCVRDDRPCASCPQETGSSVLSKVPPSSLCCLWLECSRNIDRRAKSYDQHQEWGGGGGVEGREWAGPYLSSCCC